MGTVSLRVGNRGWELFLLKEVHRAGDRHLYDNNTHCVPSFEQIYRKRQLLPGNT